MIAGLDVQAGYSPPAATNRSFAARRSLLIAASRFRAPDFDFWGSV